MGSSYYYRLARLALRDPLKIPAMLRLKTAKRKDFLEDPIVNDALPPYVIAIRPNYNCNLRCVMCNQWGENGNYIKHPERIVPREMSTDDFKRFFNDIAAFRPYIYFTGGEPLMNKDILELVRYASSKHLITSMSTNGTFLYKRARDLIEAGLDYLYTSLDTPHAMTTDIVRISAKGKDSQNEAAEAIRHVVELRRKMSSVLPIIQTQTIIVEENQHRLYEMAEFVETLGVDVWGLQLCVFTTPEQNAATTRAYQENFSQDQIGWEGFIRQFPGLDPNVINDQLERIRKRRWKFQFRPYQPLLMKGFNLHKYFFQPDEFATSEKLHCLNPYVFAQLQPNGDIAFCGSQPDYTIGNVKQDRFLNLWNNRKAKEWRKFLQKGLFPSCTRCFSLHEFHHFKSPD